MANYKQKLTRGLYDEIDMAEEVINNPEMINDNFKIRMQCLVRYYKNFPDPETGKKLTVKKIKEKLTDLLDTYADVENEQKISDIVGYYVNKYSKIGFREILEQVKEVHINYSELEAIRKVNDIVLERILFYMLIRAKLEEAKKTQKGKTGDYESEYTVEEIDARIKELQDELMTQENRAKYMEDRKYKNVNFGRVNDIFMEIDRLKKIKENINNKPKIYLDDSDEHFLLKFAGFKYKRSGSRNEQSNDIFGKLMQLGYTSYSEYGKFDNEAVIINYCEREVKDGIDIPINFEDMENTYLYYDMWRGEPVKICEECGKLFVYKKTGRPAKYCDKCTAKRKKEQKKAWSKTNK